MFFLLHACPQTVTWAVLPSKISVSSEPVFVDLLRSPGIDSHPGGPVRQPYLSYRPARLHRLAKSIPQNRFLGSINIYKYGLWKLRSNNVSCQQQRRLRRSSLPGRPHPQPSQPFPGKNGRAGHSLIFSRFAIRSPLNFFPWIADAHAFIFCISLFARSSTSGSLSEKGINHSSLSITIWIFIIWIGQVAHTGRLCEAVIDFNTKF